MGSAFPQLCPKYSGTLTPTAPTAIRLWETLTFLTINIANYNPYMNPMRPALWMGYCKSIKLVEYEQLIHPS